MSEHAKKRLAILVGGGPAPGINAVISAATIEARKADMEVVGIMDGFKWLVDDDLDKLREHVRVLHMRDVSRIHFTGGSILRTSRVNPTKDERTVGNCLRAFAHLNVNHVITIGGDDTIYAASRLAAAAQGSIKFAHVPKTIDNDLPLPDNLPTFGFETARHLGSELVKNLMEDSRTTNRWYIIVAMGRKAGHLALGMAKAAGATLAIISEEFPPGPISVQTVCDVLEGAILKRRAMGHEHGVAVVAEGLAERFTRAELEAIPGIVIRYDPYGNICLSEVDLGKILKLQLESRFAARKEEIEIVEINIGYVLRCADPIPFDCEYARDLGYSAVRYLLSSRPAHRDSALVCVKGGKLLPVKFEDVLDPATGKARLRLVDVTTESYQVALEYMVRLRGRDLEDSDFLAEMARHAKESPEQLRQRLAHVAIP
ncbi:MAG: diphosphate--fructose-6-phosphate 1-phosphotransferase [candidate division KSB1 bacterium]|nr:diphosphate--fructose-6-phosphate 1-phosphotransferase [candidate division KSB1 bacterium]MDZ7413805.1 diphosphate--fructose-6-phosphate 1-phosphotransferase [candidate division KSB1 bacterium]